MAVQQIYVDLSQLSKLIGFRSGDFNAENFNFTVHQLEVHCGVSDGVRGNVAYGAAFCVRASAFFKFGRAKQTNYPLLGKEFRIIGTY